MRKIPKLTQIIPKHISKYLSLFEKQYDNGSTYMVASRNPEYHVTKSSPPAAVTLFVLSKDRKKMLLTKEYRYPIDGWTISTPAGLIDNNEDPIQSAIRELQEETGYSKVIEAHVLPATYSSVGMTDERVHPVILQIDETIHDKQELGDGELIEYFWVDQDEALDLAMSAENLTARAQLMLIIFATENN